MAVCKFCGTNDTLTPITIGTKTINVDPLCNNVLTLLKGEYPNDQKHFFDLRIRILMNIANRVNANQNQILSDLAAIKSNLGI